MPLPEMSWGRRAAALVAAVVGAGLLVPTAQPGSAAPAPASAAEPDPEARLTAAGRGLRAADVRLTANRQTVETGPFAMLGVTWRGTPREVRVSTRSDGAWSGWRA